MLTPNAVPVDRKDWPRSEVFRFFSGMSDPFFSVTFTLDVTKLRHFAKNSGISFYYALTYLSMKAMDRVDAFHYTLRDGQIFRLETRWPSFTDLKPGAEQFHIVTMPCEGTIGEFCRAAKERSLAQEEFIRMDIEGDWLCFISCLPWVPLTALTNERDFNADDAIPRLSWGQYTERDGRYTLGMSLEVNHRFIDGVHIGRFYRTLCELMDEIA